MKKRYFIAGILTFGILAATYKFWLIFKSAHSAHFDFYPFAIILVLSYLGTLKLTDYLADFKDIKHQSRIEIVFLLVFFILLFIPMSHINQDVDSKKENRRLAAYKPLFKKHQKINYNFGNDFNSWFNDRFNLRYELFVLHNNIIMKFNPIFETNKAIFNQKTNWMFAKAHLNIEKKLDETSVKENVLVPLTKFNDFCNENNIKLYVLIAPYQPQLYPEEAAPFYSQKEVDKLNDYIKLIQARSDVKIVYPYNALKQASKSDYTYFKTEHHWTEYGAYIGYQVLMSEIKKNFKNVKVVNEQDYNVYYSNMVRGDFEREFTVGEHLKFHFPYLGPESKKFLDAKYKYYEHKDKDKLKIDITDIKYNKQKNFYYSFGNELRVIQLGTSMNENLTQFTPYTFKYLRYIRLNGVKGLNWAESMKILKYHKQEIIDYKPDIMILCLTPLNLPDIKHFSEEAE